MKSIPPKRNVVNPYSALLSDIRSFTKQLTIANNPKQISRGVLKRDKLKWLHECAVTAGKLGYRVEARVMDDNTLEFVMVEIIKQPLPNWNWT